MSSFKYKPNKKIILDEKSITTLDSKHKEIQSGYQHIQDIVIPELQQEKMKLKIRLSQIKNVFCNPENNTNNTNNYSQESGSETTLTLPQTVTIDELMEIRDRIKEINNTIKTHEQTYKSYYLNNSEYIFEYFENKKTITTGGSTKTKSLNAFFKLPDAKKAEELHMIAHNNVQKYLSNIDHNYIDISKYVYPTDICQFCSQGEMIPVESEGIMVCNHCAKHVIFLIDNEKPSYKEPPKEACFYAYKRINHFREILAQFQAKETTSIPENVIESIKQQIKKKGSKSLNSPTKKPKKL